MLPMQQHDVEVVRIRKLPQFVDLRLRIYAFVRGRHLRHKPVTVARDALQRDAEHLVHFAVRFGRLEEPNAAVIGVAHQPRELFLPQIALHLPAARSSSKREACHFQIGVAQRDPISGSLCRALDREGLPRLQIVRAQLRFSGNDVGNNGPLLVFLRWPDATTSFVADQDASASRSIVSACSAPPRA